MCGWLLLGLLFPPLLPVVLFFAFLDSFGAGRSGPPLPFKPLLLPKPLQLPPDPHLFQPVTAAADFTPAKPGATGVEHPDALCPICGLALATGNHAHTG